MAPGAEEACLAVVMPVFNEEATIRATLAEAYSKILDVHPNAFFIVSEDGSTDQTKPILQSLLKEFPNLRVHSSDRRKGYPRAARDAILAADHGADYIFFMDSDGQYDPSDFRTLWNGFVESSSDMAAGRRASRSESGLRIFLSTGLRLIERIVFRVEVRDVTSAFRLMKRDVAQDLARLVKYSKFNFWLEFTALASLRSYRTLEIPVSYRTRKGVSRVYAGGRVFQAAVLEFITILKIWSDFHLLRTKPVPEKWRSSQSPSSSLSSSTPKASSLS